MGFDQLFSPRTGNRQEKPGNDRHNPTDDHPHRAIRRVPGKEPRDIGTERMGFIESEDQQNDPEGKNSQADDVIHSPNIGWGRVQRYWGVSLTKNRLQNPKQILNSKIPVSER